MGQLGVFVWAKLARGPVTVRNAVFRNVTVGVALVPILFITPGLTTLLIGLALVSPILLFQIRLTHRRD